MSCACSEPLDVGLLEVIDDDLGALELVQFGANEPDIADIDLGDLGFGLDDILSAGKAVVRGAKDLFGESDSTKAARRRADQQRQRADRLDRRLEVERVRNRERRQRTAAQAEARRARADIQRLQQQKQVVARQRMRAEAEAKKKAERNKMLLFGAAAVLAGTAGVVAMTRRSNDRGDKRAA